MPKFRRLVRLVGAVEVLRQMKSHEKGDSRGDVRVTGKIRIDLQRIGEEGEQIFKTGEEQRRFKNLVHKLRGEKIAQDDFFGEPVQNPENGDAESMVRKEKFSVQLGNEFVGADDGAGDELRKEGQVKSEVKEIGNRFDGLFKDIDAIAYRLESKERNAHGQNNLIDERMGMEKVISSGGKEIIDFQVDAEKFPKDVQKKVGVFKIAESQQIDDDKDDQRKDFFPAVINPVKNVPADKIGQNAEGEQHQIAAAGFVVEKEARKKEEGVAKQNLAVHQSEQRKDDGKKCPKIKLRKNQRFRGIEQEQALKKAYRIHHFLTFLGTVRLDLVFVPFIFLAGELAVGKFPIAGRFWGICVTFGDSGSKISLMAS